MMRAAVTGYASLDYPVVLDGMFAGDRTTLIRHRASEAWPSLGGSVSYVARPLAAAGAATEVVTWVGDDDMGRLYRGQCAEAKLSLAGIATVSPGATPVSLMVYQEDGSCGCLFDPGFLGREVLTAAQEKLLREADLVCVTVGPPEIGLRAVELARADALFAWVLKNDPHSYPEELRERLGARADYVFCNREERGLVDASLAGAGRRDRNGDGNGDGHRKGSGSGGCSGDGGASGDAAGNGNGNGNGNGGGDGDGIGIGIANSGSASGQVIVETGGAREVLVERGGEARRLPVAALDVVDTTGAGDTLAGGTLAALAAGETDPARAVAAGIDAARRLLAARAHAGSEA